MLSLTKVFSNKKTLVSLIDLAHGVLGGLDYPERKTMISINFLAAQLSALILYLKIANLFSA